jgi:hypothetical protein
MPTVSPLPDDFSARWDTWYPAAPPLAFLLRDAYSERWFRIDSLPDGERYPMSRGEHDEIYRRHSEVATQVLGDDAECALLIFRESAGRWHSAAVRAAGIGHDDLPSTVPLPAKLWDEHDGYFVVPVELAGAVVRWRASEFSGFIAAVADDAAKGLIVNLANGRVYAPYDGGADLFLESESERVRVREQFGAWLPEDAE